ncbi:hypothetical protein RJ53_08680 [Methanocalculus chunghsingensis]|uniref:Uncharacterized protein n=1 Tax=Methanocalculus chunghsingensis TaxID=156457 RepID=A0A8J7WAV1_9EURY|nr:hypothetical protein [Methanocalculus chunghsingensis]MBR1369557.1 hypothetical protein [Methanocalculus chunghsingensis]
MRPIDQDDAISILSIILHLLLLIMIITVTLYLFMYFPGEEPKGLYVRAIEVSRGTMQVAGDPLGYSSVPRETDGVVILPSVHNEEAIGAVRVSFSPVIGDIAVDINKISVFLYQGDEKIRLTPSHQSPLSSGEWMVLHRRESRIIRETGDRSTIGLGESFDILIVLPGPLVSGDRLRLSIFLMPDTAIPIERSIPHRVAYTTLLSP